MFKWLAVYTMNIIAETVHKTKNSFLNPNNLSQTLPRITSFLVKVTARCNLNCDYCYVFNHADQSWKKMPSVLSAENRALLAKRISEYAEQEKLEECLILFHGGEPLLVGVERLIEIANLIKKEIPSGTKVYFSLQTNGTLLNKERIEALAHAGIGISLSLDGPKEVNDLHRLNHQAKSTYDKVIKAYKLLIQYPKTFTGVIAVIDPRVPPRELIAFFADLRPPQVDFLLPDANHLKPPIFRDSNSNIYIDWLIEAFDVWYDEYPELQVRMFEELLGVIAGLSSQTDAFGLGDISLLTIETDGFYHDLDVLKITEEGFSSLELHLKDYSIHNAITSSKIQAHRKLLSFEGLSGKCKACPEAKICGGGAVPHRYDKNGFQNPTIYCREMLALISHIRRRLVEAISLTHQEKELSPAKGFEDLDIINYEKTSFNNKDFRRVYNEWCNISVKRFLKVIDYAAQLNYRLKDLQNEFEKLPLETLNILAIRPSTVLWMKVLEQHQKGLKLYDIEGGIISPDPEYLYDIYKHQSHKGIMIHNNDYWLRCAFGNSIIFEPDEAKIEGTRLVQEALQIIAEFDPALKEEIELISPCIQFVRDPSAHPDKIVSFSDNVVPGALYVSIYKGNEYIDPYDLADSIIHEHRHQKLYLLEQFVPVVASDMPLIPSPWRKELRPVSGVYHGTFVFHQLKTFWKFISQNRTNKLQSKAKSQMEFCGKSLSDALKTLKTAPLTTHGKKILEEFETLNAAYS